MRQHMISHALGIPGGVSASLLVDDRWRIVSWSRAAERLFGLTSREVLGRSCCETLSCRDLYGEPLCAGRCPIANSLKRSAGDTLGDVHEILARDGGGRPLQVETAVGLTPQEAAGYVMLVLRKTAPSPIGNGRARVLDDVLDEALTTTGAEAAEIFLRDGVGQAVSLAGLRSPFPEAFTQITRFAFGEGFPGLVAERGRPLLALDAVNDPRFLRKRVADLGFQYYLCVPIPGRQSALGSLNVASRSDPETVVPQLLTVTRVAERLGLILDRKSRRAPAARRGAHLRVRCLGRFEASLGGTPLGSDRFARRRALTIFKILLTRYGHVVSRDELIDLLWCGEPPSKGATLLKVSIHYLRRALEDGESAKPGTKFISTEGDGYAFNLASSHCLDVREFETAAEEGLQLERAGRRKDALAALQRAIGICAGDYLEDEPYSDWCAEKRVQLRRKHITVLRATAGLLRQNGAVEPAIECYRRTLELDPVLEDVHRDLMDLLWRSGRRAEALRQYDACRTALRHEIDAAPVAETEGLLRSILGC